MHEIQLGIVAAHAYFRNVSLYLDGTEIVPSDELARADCPRDARWLRRWRDSLAGIRDEVLHLHEKAEDEREINVDWSAEGDLTISSTVGRRTTRRASVRRDELFGLFGELDPWLRRHFDRLLLERDRELGRSPTIQTE